MSETAQRTIFGEELNELINVETTGRVIRPFKRMLGEFADEYKLQFTDDGLHVEVVDPANVSMIRGTVHSQAFEQYETDGTTLGINSKQFGSALRHARYGKSSDDPVTITADHNHLETETTREIGGTGATVNERVELINPDSLRQTPDFPDIELSVEASLSPKAFTEVIDLLDTTLAVKLGANPESLVFNQESDIEQRNVELDVEPSEVCEFTYFSGDYLENIGKALTNGYVDNIVLRWDEDMPLMIDYEREDVYSGRIMLAPRMKPD